LTQLVVRPEFEGVRGVWSRRADWSIAPSPSYSVRKTKR
jgi:hypothetical protein